MLTSHFVKKNVDVAMKLRTDKKMIFLFKIMSTQEQDKKAVIGSW
jgi:hypothetical protein